MHSSALKHGSCFFDAYCKERPNLTIADIGALDINGSLRNVSPAGAKYIGIDAVPGNGVDIVLDNPYKIPLEDNSIDVVVCTSTFNNCQYYWVLFLEIMRILKPDGLFYLSSANNGPVDRRPVDCWRFYPDSGLALVAWAEFNGYSPLLLESFVGGLDALGIWRDFVAVFIKDKGLHSLFPNRIVQSGVECSDVLCSNPDHPSNKMFLDIGSFLSNENNRIAAVNSEAEQFVSEREEKEIVVNTKSLLHSYMASVHVLGGFANMLDRIIFMYRSSGIEGLRSIGSFAVDYCANEEFMGFYKESGKLFCDFNKIKPLPFRPGLIAIHLHVSHLELIEEIVGFLKNMPFKYHLFASVIDDHGAAECYKYFPRLAPSLTGFDVVIVPDRGRDIAPMICVFGESILKFDFVAHIHTKISAEHDGQTDGWREYLLNALCGSPDRIQQIMHLLYAGTGIVYPRTFFKLETSRHANDWADSRNDGLYWCDRMNIKFSDGYINFPVGSMFWARVDALKPLFTSGITYNDFEPEEEQTDGTLSHCLERMLALVAEQVSGKIAVIPDKFNNAVGIWWLRLPLNIRLRLSRSFCLDRLRAIRSFILTCFAKGEYSSFHEESRKFLCNLGEIVPLRFQPGRIAVHVHIFYPELAGEIAASLRNMPFQYHLFVSVIDDHCAAECHKYFSGLGPFMTGFDVVVVPNRGRDMAPMICVFGESILKFDFIAHIHTKKTPQNDESVNGWRQYLLNVLLGNSGKISRILHLLYTGTGIVYPQTFYRMETFQANSWAANSKAGSYWCERMNVKFKKGHINFPVGSMFWARVDALKPFFTSGISYNDFEPEDGQTDGTLAHCLERMLGLVAQHVSGKIAIIPDRLNNPVGMWWLKHLR